MSAKILRGMRDFHACFWVCFKKVQIKHIKLIGIGYAYARSGSELTI
jgi:hypothetical protein